MMTRSQCAMWMVWSTVSGSARRCNPWIHRQFDLWTGSAVGVIINQRISDSVNINGRSTNSEISDGDLQPVWYMDSGIHSQWNCRAVIRRQCDMRKGSAVMWSSTGRALIVCMSTSAWMSACACVRGCMHVHACVNACECVYVRACVVCVCVCYIDKQLKRWKWFICWPCILTMHSWIHLIYGHSYFEPFLFQMESPWQGNEDDERMPVRHPHVAQFAVVHYMPNIIWIGIWFLFMVRQTTPFVFFLAICVEKSCPAKTILILIQECMKEKFKAMIAYWQNNHQQWPTTSTHKIVKGWGMSIVVHQVSKPIYDMLISTLLVKICYFKLVIFFWFQSYLLKVTIWMMVITVSITGIVQITWHTW